MAAGIYIADVAPFIEAFRKMAGQYYLDNIDVCKDAVSIPGISMTYVLNKSLKKKKKKQRAWVIFTGRHLSPMSRHTRRASAL